MKVSISYSVALEEVLPLVKKLYTENKKDFDAEGAKVHSALESSFTDEQLQAILLNIKKIRIAMINFDVKLDECINMLMGYQKIINGEAPAGPTPLPQEDLDESI